MDIDAEEVETKGRWEMRVVVDVGHADEQRSESVKVCQCEVKRDGFERTTER